METTYLHLRILLPSQIFLEKTDVIRITVETTAGSYGFLPQRLDCTAALIPGILFYESVSDGEKYIAVEEGVIVKAGFEIMIAVRNAVGNASLGELKSLIDQKLKLADEKKVNMRSVIARLETSFVRNIQQLNNE
ncbi:F0F1 ATP synthase subunit epsilon [Chitinophaga silvatica]|uniref:F0F1 ATP synthase subunit epsilon n=1 Tax=Chitinophaga silvatica TaxID=2282649 RepID=A0A3E1Y630_9BACT|nr:F0F1 ATP synthase subunit epsilon [Chitinophaga silvatica]RFS20181.1 F0F1 ATP synthase subunit epsilon [Chitinophaga silvatica]